MLATAGKISLLQPGLYRKDHYFFDKHLIQQALFRSEQERVRDYLDFFKESPEQGIDELIVVLQLLQFYGLVDPAEAFSRSVYRKVQDSQEIIPGASMRLSFQPVPEDRSAVLECSLFLRFFARARRGKKKRKK